MLAMNLSKGISPSKMLTLPMCIGDSFFSKYRKVASIDVSRVLRGCAICDSPKSGQWPLSFFKRHSHSMLRTQRDERLHFHRMAGHEAQLPLLRYRRN